MSLCCVTRSTVSPVLHTCVQYVLIEFSSTSVTCPQLIRLFLFNKNSESRDPIIELSRHIVSVTYATVKGVIIKGSYSSLHDICIHYDMKHLYFYSLCSIK
jgi:hypothetical protein